ncbi:MAG: hypothetical protein RIS63_292 [Bacteroidota bacterium]
MTRVNHTSKVLLLILLTKRNDPYFLKQITILFPYFYSMNLRTGLLLFLILLQIQLFGQTYKIGFSQGDQIISGDSTRIIQIKKEPFVIAVELDSLDGVFVHCSERSVIAYGAMKRKIPDFENIGWKVSVETEFNLDQVRTYELIFED